MLKFHPKKTLQAAAVVGAVIRKPIGPEHTAVTRRTAARFGPGWASKAQVASPNRPITCWIATRESALLAFACLDATARGFFGPIGIDDAARGQGIGAPAFFKRVAAAVEISDSSPGLYAGSLPPAP